MPDSSARLTADYRRNHLLQISYAAFGVAIFAGFLVATFPYSSTLSDLLAPLGYQLSSAGQSFSFPFGVKLTGVRVTSKDAPGAPAVFESPSITIAPSLLSLLMLHPGVSVKTALYDGAAKASARRASGGIALTVELDGVNLARQPAFSIAGLSAAGIVAGAGDFWISPSNAAANTGKGELSGVEMNVRFPFAPQPVRLGKAHAEFKLDAGVLTIAKFTSSGDDLSITASGSVRLGPDPSQCALAFQFTLNPTAAGATRMQTLLATLPHPPSAGPYRLTGTLAAPNII